ncbi:hypothetical protein N7495_006038 [Penicillium taxi]|uniref:uncharacterized protein n=1 Tax=Penicillium taxi TaxID=168475 RepID=UPI0025451B50|nr:uncharacterized protein N7495_006038 [Penicillium taxi]KAJ5894347.1 hypothetical protein N7495_006038 [Penicillium taxi]
MHELLLFASVPVHQHHELLQQLAGLTAMQPRSVLERRLLFKAYRKPGIATARVGASQDAVGPVSQSDFSPAKTAPAAGADADADTQMAGMDDAKAPVAIPSTYDYELQPWKLEFRDIPEAGTRSALTARVMASAALPNGDIVPSMNAWGYSFVTEYVVEGDMFIHDDIVIFLHRVLHYPNEEKEPRQQLSPFSEMVPLEKSGSYVLQAAITVQDGNNQETMKTASQHLFKLREQLKSAVRLEQADRLSLDTRAK